ncbi:rod shape-determining protein MreD [Neobacillus muris]|uniref:rod shape-determining protein MreD n=1 Tax=Neobacillus muris TaxID=2941334 RepID=UPI00203D589C|nr:rod shape-determining protein MreD [Neobacillus muris]
MRKFLLPLLFLALFIAESLFVQFMPEKVFGQSKILVPHFLYTGLLFFTIYIGKNKGILYSAIFGLLFDIVYVEVLGIYLFLFPFVAYIVTKVMHVLQSNIIVASIVSLGGIALLEIGVYEMNFLIHVTDLDFMSFINLRFYPTLILNAIFILLTGFLFKRCFEKYSEALKDD